MFLCNINSLLLGYVQVYNYSLELTDNGWNEKTSRAFFFPSRTVPYSPFCSQGEMTAHWCFALDTAPRMSAVHPDSTLPG